VSKNYTTNRFRRAKSTRRSASQFRASAGANDVKRVSQAKPLAHALALEADNFLTRQQGKKSVNTATRAEAMTFLKKWCDLFQITDSPVYTTLVPRPEPVAPLPDRALTTRPSSLSQTQTGSVFTLHPGVVTGNTLREFSNEFASEFGKVFLDWFHDLTLRDKEWKKITPHNISDLVFNFVGVPRAEGQLVEEFIAENNWQELEDKEDTIYVLTSLLPAEYLVHVHFQSGKCTLKSRLHRILLRLCWGNRFC